MPKITLVLPSSVEPTEWELTSTLKILIAANVNGVGSIQYSKDPDLGLVFKPCPRIKINFESQRPAVYFLHWWWTIKLYSTPIPPYAIYLRWFIRRLAKMSLNGSTGRKSMASKSKNLLFLLS
jgi:hypothetical protein